MNVNVYLPDGEQKTYENAYYQTGAVCQAEQLVPYPIDGKAGKMALLCYIDTGELWILRTVTTGKKVDHLKIATYPRGQWIRVEAVDAPVDAGNTVNPTQPEGSKASKKR